jgi:hypothetical protein
VPGCGSSENAGDLREEGRGQVPTPGAHRGWMGADPSPVKTVETYNDFVTGTMSSFKTRKPLSPLRHHPSVHQGRDGVSGHAGWNQNQRQHGSPGREGEWFRILRGGCDAAMQSEAYCSDMAGTALGFASTQDVSPAKTQIGSRGSVSRHGACTRLHGS